MCKKSWDLGTMSKSERATFPTRHTMLVHLGSRGPFTCPDKTCPVSRKGGGGAYVSIADHLNSRHPGRPLSGPIDAKGHVLPREEFLALERRCFGAQATRNLVVAPIIPTPKVPTQAERQNLASAKLAALQKAAAAAVARPKPARPDSSGTKCRECGRTYASPHGRRTHIWSAHMKLQKDPVRCPAPGCDWSDSNNLSAAQNHIQRLHPGQRLAPIDERNSHRHLHAKLLAAFFRRDSAPPLPSPPSRPPKSPAKRVVVVKAPAQLLRAPAVADLSPPAKRPAQASPPRLGNLKNLVQSAERLVAETPTKRQRLAVSLTPPPPPPPPPSTPSPQQPSPDKASPDKQGSESPEEANPPPSVGDEADPEDADSSKREADLTVTLAQLSSLNRASQEKEKEEAAKEARQDESTTPAEAQPSESRTPLKSLLKKHRLAEEQGGAGKKQRSNVSFAEEIRIQSISPRPSPVSSDSEENEEEEEEEGEGSADEEVSDEQLTDSSGEEEEEKGDEEEVEKGDEDEEKGKTESESEVECAQCLRRVRTGNAERHVWEAHVQVTNPVSCPSSDQDVRAGVEQQDSDVAVSQPDTTRMETFLLQKSLCFPPKT